MVEPGMEALLDTFIYETNTMLEQLDEILLESEKAKSISEENINSIFRITHTIKGSAAMMGFNAISGLAHAVEDVFYIIRETPAKMDIIYNALFDLVFQTVDFLKREIEKVPDNNYVEEDASSLVAQLENQAKIMNGEAPSEAAPAPVMAEPTPSYSSEGGMHHIRVFFEDDCQMENMRAFMLMTQLKSVCEVLESDPPHPEGDSSLCSEIVRNGFVLICKPVDNLDDILKIIENSINVKTYELLPDESTAPIVAEDLPSEQQVIPDLKAPVATDMGTSKAAKQSLISVNQAKLDHLMDLVGELVTAESMVASNPDLKGLRLDNFTKSVRELRKLTDELQDIVMSIRMVPLHSTFQKMNRIVRDMSKKLDKKVELVTEGGDTEVDKTINDIIADPFMHMIRNAMDHAIESPAERVALGKSETGHITLAARNVGGEILIDVADDGQGLDASALLVKAKKNGILVKPESEYTEREAFQLIMLPGFSTNVAVTEYSGRGVGMDVVRKNVEKVGGTISINSVLHQGTTFTIKIPLTLAIVDGMNLAVGSTVFTLPITSINQSFKVTDPKQIICNTNGEEMIMIRGECLPIYRLHQLFGIDTVCRDITDGILIQCESGTSSACIFADELLGEYQVVVKPFPTFFNRYGLKEQGLSGCSILGDGSISLILDANNLITE